MPGGFERAGLLGGADGLPARLVTGAALHGVVGQRDRRVVFVALLVELVQVHFSQNHSAKGGEGLEPFALVVAAPHFLSPFFPESESLLVHFFLELLDALVLLLLLQHEVVAIEADGKQAGVLAVVKAFMKRVANQAAFAENELRVRHLLKRTDPRRRKRFLAQGVVVEALEVALLQIPQIRLPDFLQLLFFLVFLPYFINAPAEGPDAKGDEEEIENFVHGVRALVYFALFLFIESLGGGPEAVV